MEAHAPHSKDPIALPLILDKASLAGMLRPVTTDSEASALLASLCTLRDRVAGHSRVWRADTFTASLRIAREAVGLTDLRELFGAVGRWALAAYDGDVLKAVPVWAPGSGPRTATYTAAQCRYTPSLGPAATEVLRLCLSGGWTGLGGARTSLGAALDRVCRCTSF